MPNSCHKVVHIFSAFCDNPIVLSEFLTMKQMHHDMNELIHEALRIV